MYIHSKFFTGIFVVFLLLLLIKSERKRERERTSCINSNLKMNMHTHRNVYRLENYKICVSHIILMSRRVFFRYLLLVLVLLLSFIIQCEYICFLVLAHSLDGMCVNYVPAKKKQNVLIHVSCINIFVVFNVFICSVDVSSYWCMYHIFIYASHFLSWVNHPFGELSVRCTQSIIYFPMKSNLPEQKTCSTEHNWRLKLSVKYYVLPAMTNNHLHLTNMIQ